MSCNQNDCNNHLSSDEVVYKGPNLTCTGIENCDTLTVALQKIDEFICGPNMAQVIINNIINNTTLYQQFVNIVNINVKCSTVLACLSTTTTTTTCICQQWTIQIDSEDTTVADGGIIYVDFDSCEGRSRQLQFGQVGTFNPGLCLSPGEVPNQYFFEKGEKKASSTPPAINGCCGNVNLIYVVKAISMSATWAGISPEGDDISGNFSYSDGEYELPCMRQSTLVLTGGVLLYQQNCI